MITVVCPHLVAVDAAWDDGPDAGRWIADRLGPFGPSVGHAVPLGEGFHDCGARAYCDGLTGELLRITTCCVGA